MRLAFDMALRLCMGDEIISSLSLVDQVDLYWLHACHLEFDMGACCRTTDMYTVHRLRIGA